MCDQPAQGLPNKFHYVTDACKKQCLQYEGECVVSLSDADSCKMMVGLQFQMAACSHDRKAELLSTSGHLLQPEQQIVRVP